MRLHGIERRLIDDRRHLDGHDLAGRLELLGLAALVELVLADICRAGQDTVNLPDAPASAVTGEDAVAVEIRVMFFTPIGPDVPSPSRASL